MDEAQLDAIRHANDLVEFVSRFVTLKREGAEYRGLCPFHDDHNPSLSLNSSKQVWACFSCNAHETHGADIFGFTRSYFNCTFPEAVEKLSNGNGALPDAKPIVRSPLKKAPPRQLLVPPFGDEPDLTIKSLGAPLKVWTIQTLDGEPWFMEARYVAMTGPEKQTRLWTFGRYSDTDPPRWECKHPPAPRPFFGLEALTDRPQAQVMIHEAAKKAEAARALFPALVHLGLVGGVNQVPHTDLAPLRGRRCVLLPDNDEPGKQAMRRLAPLLWAAGVVQVKGIDPETQPDGSLSPVGWDVADSEWSPTIAMAWAKKNVLVYANEAALGRTGAYTSPDLESAGSLLAVKRAQVAGAIGSDAVQVPDAASPLNAVPDVGFPVGSPSPPTATPGPLPLPPEVADVAPGEPVGVPVASPPTAKDSGKRAKPALGVVEGSAIRKPNLEIEPEAELLPAFSEFALGQRFADGPGQDWRYTAAWNVWARWIGHRWEPDECRAITWEVKNCCKAAMQEHIADSTPGQRLKITTLKTVNAVATLAGTDPRLAVAVSAWDSDPMLLGTPAGIIDLRTGLPVQAERAQMISRSTGCAPAQGEHPWWDKVLERAHRGDAGLLAFIQRWCGYLLTGDTREERFLFIHGPGAGGKSKFLQPLADILGDYRRTAKMDSFTARERSEHSEEIARLAGARLVTATETEEGSRWNESRIKALTGRDPIAARHMHKSTFEFQPQFKLVFVGNHRPALRSVGEEMRRRIDLIEWGGTIPEGERILDLPDKLRAEYPAILAWMIEGCMAWQREGLGKPESVETATREYLISEDTFGAWLEECVSTGADQRCSSKGAYASFVRWAQAAGEYVPSQKRFSQKLLDRGFQSKRSATERQFMGFSLRVSEHDDIPPSWVPD